MDLYHSEIGLPKGFKAPTQRVSLLWTKHADHARKSDRYAHIPKFKSANLAQLTIIEVGVERGHVTKILFRGKYTENLDLCVVLIPNGAGEPWVVKTCWVNERNDSHKTLDRSKYVC